MRALAALGDGALASAGFDHSVILWDAASGRARRVSRWHGASVNALAALPGGAVASAGEDGRVAVQGEYAECLNHPSFAALVRELEEEEAQGAEGCGR